jgi:hypothetical protein
MRYALTLLAVSPTLIGSARGSPDIPTHGGGTKVWMGLTAPPVYGVDPSWARGVWLALPGYGRSPPDHSAVACDRFGRCCQLGLSERRARGDIERPEARPPGWAENLPGSARMQNRFLGPGLDGVCDRATTRICYQ